MQGIDIIFSIGIIIFSAVAHEVSHGCAAFMLGDPTARNAGRLTLNPIKHLDPVGSVLVPLLLVVTSSVGGGQPFWFGWAKPVPFNPYNLRVGRWGPAIVAAAGPCANLLIAVFFGILIRFVFSVYFVPIALLHITTWIVIINLNLAVFNLVPIPPLDGSKVLFALLPYRYISLQRFLERYGLLLLIFFIFILGNVLIPFESFLFHLITGLQ